jgi:group I intron endonuclease
LIADWEAKGFRCLNTQKCKTYEDKKQDPTFLYNKARKEVLRQIKKTGKMPKDATLEKYQIKDEEVKECMGRKGIIYKITSPSGKVYVGQTVRSFEKRMREHKQGSSCCTFLKSAIDKYKDQMKYEIIEDNVPQEQLDEREIYWIKELNSLAPNGYNLTSGGTFKTEYSQETKNRIRDGMIKSKIERDGYLGSVRKVRDWFYPRIRLHGKNNDISCGGFKTKEEAIEVLKKYTKDPDNFEKVDNRTKSRIGYICKNGFIWQLKHKGKHIGYYATEEEAEEARKALAQSSTYTSSSEIG